MTPEQIANIKQIFPNASESFLRQLVQNPPVVTRLRDPKPQLDARPQPLDPDQDEKGSPPRTSGRVKVTIIRHGIALLDFDNGAGGCKALVDALRYEGLIVNDDPGSIEFVFTQRKVSRKNKGTEIIIEQI